MNRVARIGIVLLAAGVLCFLRIALVLLGVGVYLLLLPGVIAMKRDYPHADRVLFWCALLGWTGAAWIAALVFVLTRRASNVREVCAAARLSDDIPVAYREP